MWKIGKGLVIRIIIFLLMLISFLSPNLAYSSDVSHLRVPIIMQDEKEEKYSEILRKEIEYMLEQVCALLQDYNTPPKLRATAEKLEQIYLKLPEAAELILSCLQRLSKDQRLDLGEIKLYMVGGRVKEDALLLSYIPADTRSSAENPVIIKRVNRETAYFL